MRSASVSVSPRARWSGCSATWLNEASLAVFEDETFVPDPALERVLGSARKPAPVASPAAHGEGRGRGVARVLVRVLAILCAVEPGIDLDEERQPRLVEGPDREALPEPG